MSREAFLQEERFRGLRQRLLTSAAGFYTRLAPLLEKETDRDSPR